MVGLVNLRQQQNKERRKEFGCKLAADGDESDRNRETDADRPTDRGEIVSMCQMPLFGSLVCL